MMGKGYFSPQEDRISNELISRLEGGFLTEGVSHS